MNRSADVLRVGIFLAMAVTLLAAIRSATAYPPEKPYDPRPLLPEVEKRTTSDKYSFAVFGDVKGSRAFLDVVKQAESRQPAFALLTGDMVAAGTETNYDTLEKQFGAFMQKIPSWPCIGNHETGGKGVGMYFKFYGINERHYHFDFRNARFICVDAPSKAAANAAELKWLEPLLEEGKKAGKLLFVWQHSPPYTVGTKKTSESPGKPTDLTRLYTKYGVVAVFCGHDHIYYRTTRDSVNYIIQGAGGAGVYSLDRRGEALPGDAFYGKQGRSSSVMHTPAGDKIFDKLMFLMTEIQVDGTKVTGKTVTAIGGEVLDEFTLAPLPEVKLGEAKPKSEPAKPPAVKPEPPVAKPEPVGVGTR